MLYLHLLALKENISIRYSILARVVVLCVHNVNQPLNVLNVTLLLLEFFKMDYVFVQITQSGVQHSKSAFAHQIRTELSIPLVMLYVSRNLQPLHHSSVLICKFIIKQNKCVSIVLATNIGQVELVILVRKIVIFAPTAQNVIGVMLILF